MKNNRTPELLAKLLAGRLAKHGAVSEFCRVSGIGRTTVDQWIEGKNAPSLENVDRIADYFQMSTAALIAEATGSSDLTPRQAKMMDMIRRCPPAREPMLEVVIRTLLEQKIPELDD